MNSRCTPEPKAHTRRSSMRRCVCVLRDAGQFNYPIFMCQKQYYAHTTNERWTSSSLSQRIYTSRFVCEVANLLLPFPTPCLCCICESLTERYSTICNFPKNPKRTVFVIVVVVVSIGNLFDSMLGLLDGNKWEAVRLCVWGNSGCSAVHKTCNPFRIFRTNSASCLVTVQQLTNKTRSFGFDVCVSHIWFSTDVQHKLNQLNVPTKKPILVWRISSHKHFYFNSWHFQLLFYSIYSTASVCFFFLSRTICEIVSKFIVSSWFVFLTRSEILYAL